MARQSRTGPNAERGIFHPSDIIHVVRINVIVLKSFQRECFKMLKRIYKFYLSFENNICDEYITEKAWNALKHDIVPVVLGGADYASLLPPHSYIDVANFTSPKALATYLRQVANDDDLYRSYFRWKRDYYIAGQDRDCALCEFLSSRKSEKYILPSFNSFWNRTKFCRTPDSYYSSFLDHANNSEELFR